MTCPSWEAQNNWNELFEAAKTVFNWYYIFGEDNEAAREHLARLGNAVGALEPSRSE